MRFGEYKPAGPGFAHGGFQGYLHDLIADGAVSFYWPVPAESHPGQPVGTRVMACRSGAISGYFGAELDPLPLLLLFIIFFFFAANAGPVWDWDGRRG